MELWTSLGVLLRRWYLILPCLALTALLAVQLAGQVRPTYEAEGTVVFLRPVQAPAASAATPATDNPWQTVDYALNQFALLMGQAASSDAFQDRVVAAGGSPTFSVTTSATQAQGSPTNQTPTLVLSTTAASPEAAMASYEVLGDVLDDEVKDRQRSVGAAESTWITVVDLTVPPGAQERAGSRTTVLIAAVLAGTLTSMGLVFAVDGALVVRRFRRDSGRAATDGAGADAAPDEARADGEDEAERTGPSEPVAPDGPVRLTTAPERGDAGAGPPELPELIDVDVLTLDDLIEDDPVGQRLGPRRPAIPGVVDEAVGQ